MPLLKPPTPESTRASPSARTPAAATGSAPRWPSGQLLAGQREAHIEHEGTTYRLRLTSLGKLILTK